jgi:predicted nucleic acid-binding protein
MSAAPSMIFAVPELLTIDATVAFDYIGGAEPRHALAVELVERARRGQVELAAAPQGYRLDLTKGRAQSIAELRAAFAREGVRQARQVARVSEVTFPGPDLFPGNHVEGFAEACEQIAEDWPRAPGAADRFHVETHLTEQRDVFITDDRRLLRLCRRLRDEHGFPLVAMRLADYLAARPRTSDEGA